MTRFSQIQLALSTWVLAASFVAGQPAPVRPSTSSSEAAPNRAVSPNLDEPTNPPPRGALVVSRTTQIAKLRTAPEAHYPPLARSAKVQGVCRFNVLIGENGSVLNIVLLRGQPLLVNAAKEAVLQYRYEPTIIEGVERKVWTIVDVDFVLTKK